jgi:transcriptional regulator with XRE-family HTH domain
MNYDKVKSLAGRQISEFGKALRAIRSQRDVLLIDLAVAANVSVATVSNFETGRSQPTLDFIERVSDYLTLTEFERQRLKRIAAEQATPVIVRAQSLEARSLAEEFAKRVNSLSPERIEQVRKQILLPMTSGDDASRYRAAKWVHSRSAGDIEHKTLIMRRAFGVEDAVSLPIVHILELRLPTLFEGFLLRVADMAEMEEACPGVRGFAIGEAQSVSVVVREDVYCAACEDDPVARWIFAHEMGHVVLNHGLGYRAPGKQMSTRALSGPPLHENAEWQADEFAAAILMPRAIVSQWSPQMIAERCEVSERMATKRLRKLNRK